MLLTYTLDIQEYRNLSQDEQKDYVYYLEALQVAISHKVAIENIERIKAGYFAGDEKQLGKKVWKEWRDEEFEGALENHEEYNEIIERALGFESRVKAFCEKARKGVKN